MEGDKPLRWVGTSKEDLSALPVEVKRVFGFALRLAQKGKKHTEAKPLTGFGGASVLEVVEDLIGDTFRAVYTVRFRDAVYVLHAFQKKSKRGSELPKRDRALIQRRLIAAERDHKERMTKGKTA